MISPIMKKKTTTTVVTTIVVVVIMEIQPQIDADDALHTLCHSYSIRTVAHSCARHLAIAPRVIGLATRDVCSRQAIPTVARPANRAGALRPRATLALHFVLQNTALATVQRLADGLVEEARSGRA